MQSRGNAQSELFDDGFSDSLYRIRLASLLLFSLYSFLLTYWFSSVVDLITPGVVMLCLLLAWGSLKVNANWIALGEFVVLAAKFGVQSPRIELLAGLWLSYVGIVVFAFRSQYSSLLKQLLPALPGGVKNIHHPEGKRLIDCVFAISKNAIGTLLIVVIGCVLLMYSPFGEKREEWIAWTLQRSDGGWSGVTLVVILLGLVIVLREWNWRRISPGQASLYLRTDRVRWQYQELSRVVRTMLKQGQNKSRVD